MRLRQMFLALSLIPTLQMSASAQRVFSDWDEKGNLLSQYSVEIAKVSTPGDDSTLAELAGDAVTPKVTIPTPVPTPLAIALESRLHADSYMDAYRILREENTCSRFFGGTLTATEVLNRFTEHLQTRRFDNPNIAIEMSGEIMLVNNHKTGASYRLFEQVAVNSLGPLYVQPMLTQVPRRLIGRFSTDTRAARTLIILHEIGHLVQGADGHWLLPNDGHNAELSRRNTNTVENRCLKQLQALKP
jgi:hypothetical protein